MTTDRLIAVALIILCCAPITFILLRARIVAAWHRLTSRLAVEVRRAHPVRREGKHTEARLDMQWADDIAPCCTHPGTGICMCDCHDDLDPLPLYDEGIAIRERYRREAWAATGMTPAEYWASVTPDAPCCSHPGTGICMCDCHDDDGAADLPGPTPNQAMNLWQPHDVIPPRIAATLARATADQTVIDTSHATLEPYIIGLAGGDPFDGLGQDAWLDRLFAPVGAR